MINTSKKFADCDMFRYYDYMYVKCAPAKGGEITKYLHIFILWQIEHAQKLRISLAIF